MCIDKYPVKGVWLLEHIKVMIRTVLSFGIYMYLNVKIIIIKQSY